MHPVDPSIITDGTTFINPVGLAFTLLMCVLLVVVPRRYALLPIIALVCYMTMGMRFVIGGLNFTMLRIVLLFGWARLVMRGELKSFKLNPIDKTIIAWILVSIVTYTLLWGDYESFKYKLGGAYTVLGFYFMFRFLLRDKEDVVWTLKIFAVLVLPLAGAMVLEKMTGRDPFGVFGGVPPITTIRDGALRCEGPFGHPILAGTFGATMMPLFVGLWWYQERKRFFVVLAMVAAAIITITSASSGPLLTFVLGLVGLSLWPLRLRMRQLRWGIVAGIAALQMVMKAPFWFLLGKIDIVQGSTGYHRALLIDRAIANLPGWWLIGTKSTWAWASEDDHLFDVTNAYIQNGADGGLITMILFTAVIVLSFKAVGRTVLSNDGHEPKKDTLLLWALGATLFAHAATFISISYFDQNFVNWYLLLAMISTIAGPSLFVSRPEFFESLRRQAAGNSTSGFPGDLARPGVCSTGPGLRPSLQRSPNLRFGELPKLRPIVF